MYCHQSWLFRRKSLIEKIVHIFLFIQLQRSRMRTRDNGGLEISKEQGKDLCTQVG